MATDVVMPQLGQAMVTGVIVAWHVKDGEPVSAGAPLLTIESDKSAFEIESPTEGVLRHKVPEGAEADVGAVLATIAVQGEAVAQQTAQPSPAVEASGPRTAPTAAAPGASRVLASPRARAAATGRIDLADVVPAGADGMITVADVERAIASSGLKRETGSAGTPERRQAITPSHRSAIRRLQQSWSQAPHIVQMLDVDATRLVAAQALMRSGVIAATLNDVIIKAAADTMAEFDDLNSHIVGDEIITSDQVDVSIAVATDRGLRTPVLRSVAGLPLDEVAAKTRAAIEAARAGRAITGRASLTISNLGRYGIRCGTPVLNLDEAVLVFVGEIKDRPAVQDGIIAARPEMTLSIAYDHRVVDGLRAAEFSAALRRRLESLDIGQVEDEPAADVAHSGRSAKLISPDGLRCELTDASGHRWVLDEPASIGGTNLGPDPVTSVLGALLSCLTISFRLAAKRRGVAIDRIEASVATEQQEKVRAISVLLDVWSAAPPDKVEALLKPAKNACYVHDMLRPDLDLEVRLQVRT